MLSTAQRISLITLSLLFTAVPAATADLDIALRVPSGEISPRSFLTLVLEMRHGGNDEQTFDVGVELPAGWQTVSPPPPVTVGAGERQRRFITIAIPPDALAMDGYVISCTAQSRREGGDSAWAEARVAIGRHRDVALRLLDHQERAYPGETVHYSVAIVNRGNAADDFVVSLVSSHRWPVRFTPRTISLAPGESRVVDLEVLVPADLARRTTDRLRILLGFADASAESPGVSVEEVVTLESLPSPSAAVGSIYPTLPARMTLSARERSDGPIESQVELFTAGDLPDGYHTALYVRQKLMRGEEADETDYYRLDFGNDRWDLSLGDTNDQYTRLTSDLHGRGARLRLRSRYLDSSTFVGTRDAGEGLEERAFGTQVVGKPGRRSNLALTHVTLQEVRLDERAVAPRDTRQVSALVEQELLDGWSVGAELAASDGQEHSRTLQGTAWRVTSTLHLDSLHGTAEVYHADTDYTGGLRDREGYRTYWRYAVSQPLTLWLDHERYQNNLELEPDRSATLTTRTILGTQLSLRRWPVLTLSGEIRNQEDRHRGAPSGDEESLFVRMRLLKSFRRLSLSGGGEWGRRESRSGMRSTTRYDGAATFSLDRYYGRIGYRTSVSQDTRHTIGLDEREQWEAELGGRLLDNRLQTSVSYRGDLRTGDDHAGASVRLRVSYRVNRANTLSFETEYRDLGEESESRLCLLSWTHTFGMPVPIAKVASRSSGRLFVDTNDNGRYDDGDRPLPKVAVGLGEQQVYTDQEGEFHFAPVPPGIHDMIVETAQLPAELQLARPDDLRLRLEQPGDHYMELPVCFIGGLAGTVYEDANGNGVRDAGEQPLGFVRLLLHQDGQAIRETFTDGDGTYFMTDLMSGSYDVQLDVTSLPTRYQVTTPNPMVAEVGSARRPTLVDFGCRKEPRVIKRTFTQ